ncbi:uncharacterized protein BO88DRAFT_418118 [Aspergillus vadensis CBS 113365]|uniref:Uncharacterized protein n=1 Tax=Aspergillus vadensis (strain CBS 113365 / IMI 142717 / IBT 24658) TaxID=1448311 RepID=A0A319B1C2_ASPVC|nr:hypothetical protein BO88DRAFT_418118 [Aspergillus vadensis CBS 113365]PYH65955.1 hypothetical protein BO88DRAFT_418118 [Aspergillus vadensis CBS 113365]
MSTDINYNDPLSGNKIDNLIDQTLYSKGIQTTLRHETPLMKVYSLKFDFTHPEADRDYIDSPYQSLFIAVKAALALANTDVFTQVFSLCGIHEEHCKGPFPPIEKVMVENRSSVYHFHVRGNLSQRLVVVPEILLDGVLTEPNDVDTQRQQSIE